MAPAVEDAPLPGKQLVRRRWLHVISTVNPGFGGPVEGMTQLGMINRELGHSVEVASLDDPADPWVEACPLRCHALGPGALRYSYSARLVPWLKQHRQNYDAVVVHGIWQYGSFAAWRALSGTSTPYFVFTHGMLDPWFKHTYPLKHLKKWLYWPWADYRVLRDAASVMFTCEEERRLARQTFWLYRCNEFIVNYGIKGPTGEPKLQRETFLSLFPHLTGKRCLLFLGRVHEKKGLDLALEAFASVLRDHPEAEVADLHFVVAGPADGTYGAKMKASCDALGIGPRVTWTGMLRADAKWGALHTAEAFILPSHQENFGIAVAEALSCAVPVLISDKVNIWREIQQDGAGLVERDDLPGARRLIERWLATGPAEWTGLRSRARLCFERHFSVERTAQSLDQAINHALEKLRQ